MKKRLIIGVTAVLALTGCATGMMFGPAPKDGELAMPTDYQSWPVFVSGIEKSSGHIRDIYINNKGADAKKGEAFPNGTQTVMEIYNAQKDSNGKLQKTGLAKVFVMSKGKGWGASAPEGMQTGDWVYSAFDSKGQPLKVDYSTCRGCHLPLADKDFIFHYDKYFDTRASLEGKLYANMKDIHGAKITLTGSELAMSKQLLK